MAQTTQGAAARLPLEPDWPVADDGRAILGQELLSIRDDQAAFTRSLGQIRQAISAMQADYDNRILALEQALEEARAERYRGSIQGLDETWAVTVAPWWWADE